MKSTIILLAVLCLISCNDQEKTAESNSLESSAGKIKTRLVKAHNFQNSLDWSGVYEGVLPCENCEGIETSIRLKKNLDYVLSQNYLGSTEVEENSIRETGKIEWNKQGNTISLGKRKKLYFQVSKNYLLQVFEDESKVMGDSAMKYRLTKINSL